MGPCHHGPIDRVRNPRVNDPLPAPSLSTVLLVTAVLLGGARSAAAAPEVRTLFVPEPAVVAAAPPPAIEPSYVRLPLTVSLSPLLARLEETIPRRLDTAGRYEGDEEGVELAYDIRRDPFAITARHDTLLISAPVAFSVRARAPKLAPISCGSDGAPMRGRLGCITRVGWGDAWHLDARSLPLPMTFERHCDPELQEVDLTEAIGERIVAGMVTPLSTVATAALREGGGARATIDAAWRALETPSRIGGDRWFGFSPRRVLAGSVAARGESLVTEVAIEVAAGITSAPIDEAARPLPETTVRLFGDELVVPFDCEVPLDTLARELEQALGDSVAPASGGRVQVHAVRLAPGGDRLLVTLELQGALTGRVHLLGSLEFEPNTSRLTLKGLEWTPETNAALRAFGSGTPAALRGQLESLRSRARAALRVDFSREVAGVVGPLGRLLNRPLTDSLAIEGGIHQRRPLGTFVTERTLGVRIAATGRARIVVR